MNAKNTKIHHNTLVFMATLFATFSLVFCLSGCKPVQATFWNGQTEFENKMEYVDRAYQIEFPGERTTISSSQSEKIKSVLRNRGSIRTINIAACYQKNSRANQTRLHNVKSEIYKLGYSANVISPRHSHSHNTSCVLVYVNQLAVAVADCHYTIPDTEDRQYNKIYEGFGCATEKNLGFMIANPEDLDSNEIQDGVRSQRATESIRRYDQGETAPLYQDPEPGVTIKTGY